VAPRIRGSDVYVVEDIERILNALAGAARRYGGEYGQGYGDALRDVAAGGGGGGGQPLAHTPCTHVIRD